MNSKVVYDLGFHNGDDTFQYLEKGFKVVAVEANPSLVNEGKKRFSKELQSEQLVLLNMAVVSDNKKVSFYIHPTKSHWSSCYHDIAQSDGSVAQKIEVDGVSITTLFEKYGVPHYMKVDIEGADLDVAKALVTLKEKPQFVSFETNRREFGRLYSYLFTSGYNQFALTNQIRNKGHSSGSFGVELAADRWLPLEASLTNYVLYKELKKIDNQDLAIGWLDLHARLY